GPRPVPQALATGPHSRRLGWLEADDGPGPHAIVAVFKSNRGAHAPAERLDNRKSQSAAFDIGILRQAVKALEYPLPLGDRNARAIVLDLDQPARPRHPDKDVAAGFAVTDRIVDEIGDNFSGEQGAATHRNMVAVRFERHVHRAVQRPAGITARDAGGAFHQIENARVVLVVLWSLRFGKGDQLDDQVLERLD